MFLTAEEVAALVVWVTRHWLSELKMSTEMSHEPSTCFFRISKYFITSATGYDPSSGCNVIVA